MHPCMMLLCSLTIGERAEQTIRTMELLGIDAGRMEVYAADVLAEAFGFGDMDYFAGIKLFNRVRR